MGKFGEMLGKIDDRSVIYRTDDPEQRVSWKRALVAPAIIAAMLVAARAAGIDQDMVIGVLGVLVIVSLPFYVMWRRRRNNRMTGRQRPGRPSTRDVPMYAAGPATDSTTAPAPAPLAITNSAWRRRHEPAFRVLSRG